MLITSIFLKFSKIKYLFEINVKFKYQIDIYLIYNIWRNKGLRKAAIARLALLRNSKKKQRKWFKNRMKSKPRIEKQTPNYALFAWWTVPFLDSFFLQYLCHYPLKPTLRGKPNNISLQIMNLDNKGKRCYHFLFNYLPYIYIYRNYKF